MHLIVAYSSISIELCVGFVLYVLQISKKQTNKQLEPQISVKSLFDAI